MVRTNSIAKQRRTRTGCLCCRRRHKKCDERKPSCNFCVTKGLKCEWPRQGIVFVNYNLSDQTNIEPNQGLIYVDINQSEPKEQHSVESPRNSVSYSTIPSNFPNDTQMSHNYSLTSVIRPVPTSPPNRLESNGVHVFSSLPVASLSINQKSPGSNMLKNEPLPSMKQYHFIQPRDRVLLPKFIEVIQTARTANVLDTTNSSTEAHSIDQTATKRLSVSSLLN